MRQTGLYVGLLRWITAGYKPKAKGSCMDATKDLTFVATKDLINELSKRHDALVVGGMNFKTKDHYNVVRFRNGHRHVCLGLLSNIASIINDEENKNLQYNSEDNG